MELLKSIISYIGSSINYSANQKKLAVAYHQQQVRDWYHYELQMQLQEALFQVLHRANVFPLLCTLNDVHDLLLCNYIYKNDKIYYLFMWTKSTDDVISVPTLRRYVAKMNRLIQEEQRKFHNYINRFDSFTQNDLIQMNPILYNGFHVGYCKNENDSILLAVSFN